MPEPIKNLLNSDAIIHMANEFDKHCVNFNKKAFIEDACYQLDQLELKQRTDRITETIKRHFPANFEQASHVILSSLGPELGSAISFSNKDAPGINGWQIMPLANYVGLYGQEHFELSMTLLKALTKRASSEFAIRLFLLKQHDKTMSVLSTWVSDPDHHVRRLVSEGSRPRLPWAMQLPMFIDDPSALMPLLNTLKDDQSEYVRRSVANNLNDIAKDHPDTVADIAQQWLLNASSEREKLVRHACRTLIKNGHQKTLTALGYKTAVLEKVRLQIETTEVTFGDHLQFNLSLASKVEQDQPLIVDYIIHHKKANGKTSPKVFKWRTTTLLSHKTLSITKKHAIKKITTRQYYAGLHHLEIMVNGIAVAKSDFMLRM